MTHHGPVLVPARIVDHAGHHGQAGGLGFGQGDFDLLQVHHGFDDQGVGAGPGQGPGLLAENFVQFVRADVAGDQQLAAGPDGSKYQSPLAGRFLGDGHALLVYFLGPIPQPGLVQNDAVGPESVGQNNPTPGFDVAAGHFLDQIGPF